MPNTWPKPSRLLGTKQPRLDGPAKSTGMAKYSFDINLPGLLHGRILRCPHAHATVKSVDTSAAEKTPGFKALYRIAKDGNEMTFAGQEIIAIAADTEEHAMDVARAIKVDYEVLPSFVKAEDALKNPNAKTMLDGVANVGKPNTATTGDIDSAFKVADAVVEGTYGAAIISHQCLESHGLVAAWDKDGNLTVYASTQATYDTAGELAKEFKILATKVKCITHYMGGGFGCKFGAYVEGKAAAHLAKAAGAPVKLMLDRAEEITTGGNRPSVYGTVKIGGTKDGKITAYEVDCHGSPGVATSPAVNFGVLPYIYGMTPNPPIANVRKKHTVVRLNSGTARAMRAPGHPQNCILTDCPLDDFAAKIGMDPFQVRLKNLPQNDLAVKDGVSFNGIRNDIYMQQLKIAAELSAWEKTWHPPGKGPLVGPVKHGIGMAMHTWAGVGVPGTDVTISINSDGSVLLRCSVQDLGTAARTVLAMITAEVLGLEPKDITVQIGESEYGRSRGSGGSITTPSISPACLNAACAARDEFFKMIASKLEVKPEELSILPGMVANKAGDKKWSWNEACARLGMDVAKQTGTFSTGLSNQGVGGVQIIEVLVDTETGVVRCTKAFAVQDCGLIINKLACESQVTGGVIMGVNYALFEENILDRHTGRQVNPDMEFYKLGGIEDMPRIVVHMMDMPHRGVIGIGEPPTISTCAAVGNAVFNAIGVRVPNAPYTPERVLTALNQKGGA